MHGAALRSLANLERVHAVEPDAPGAGVLAILAFGAGIGVPIGHRGGMAAGIPFFAIHRAGVTADADIQVDDQTELGCAWRGGQTGHCRSPLAPYLKMASPRGTVATGVSAGNCGSEVSPGRSSVAFSTLTLRSNQAAWPVTGSALA